MTWGGFLPGWFVYFAEVLQQYRILQSDEGKNRLLQEIACRNLVMRAGGHLGWEMKWEKLTWILTASAFLGTFLLNKLCSRYFRVSSLYDTFLPLGCCWPVERNLWYFLCLSGLAEADLSSALSELSFYNDIMWYRNTSLTVFNLQLLINIEVVHLNIFLSLPLSPVIEAANYLIGIIHYSEGFWLKVETTWWFGYLADEIHFHLVFDPLRKQLSNLGPVCLPEEGELLRVDHIVLRNDSNLLFRLIDLNFSYQKSN